MYGIDDWLETAYEDRNGGDVDTASNDDGDEDEMFQDFHDNE